MSAHTPGPWRLEFDDDMGMPEHGDRCRFIRAAGVHGALMGGVKYYPWTPENLADWQLIAAAPELLDALKRAVETIRVWHNMGHYAGEADHVWQLYQRSPEMQQITAAIAKAEGR